MQPTNSREKEEVKDTIEAVVEQVKAGEKQAYQVIILQFEKQMFTYCYYILKNHTETEDAVQEIFILAYQNIQKYRIQASFSAWLYKIAYHHLINMKRKQGRWLKLIEHYQEQQPKEHFSQHESVVYDLLSYLTSEERHILLLKAVEQYTFEEISEIMDLKSATVRKKYERLRKKLMGQINEKGEKKHVKIAGTNGIR